MKRMVSGIQPTGNLTIGNYIGAIKQFVNFQNEYEMFVFIANMHAITVEQSPKLREKTRELLGLYFACGLDPEKITVYLQSENPYHTELSWILECHSYMGELSRMTQFKEKSAKINDKSISLGLFTYPVLMASDILIYDADFVPVGEDQKQHVEITRDIGVRMNNKYNDIFTIPTPIIPKVGARIMDLQDPTSKMSKTNENPKGNIYLLDEDDVIRRKIMSAVTDSESKVYYDPEKKPGISNLITIYAAIENISFNEVEKLFEDANYGAFKNAVAERVILCVSAIRNKYYSIIESDIIDNALDKGIEKVKPLAKKKCELIKEKIGLVR